MLVDYRELSVLGGLCCCLLPVTPNSTKRLCVSAVVFREEGESVCSDTSHEIYL